MSTDDATGSSAASEPVAAPANGRSWLPYLILLAMFLIGSIVGAGAMQAYMHQQWQDGGIVPPDRGKRTRMRLRSMKRKLGLNDDQSERVKAILEAADERRHAAAEPCRAKLDANKQQLDKVLAEVLTAEQLESLKKMRKRHPRHKRRKGPRGQNKGPRRR